MLNDDPPSLPADQPPPLRRRGLGCFAKGCLTAVTVVMLLGVALGTFGWLIVKSGRAYFTEQPTPTRVSDVTDEQYQALLARLEPFAQAMNEGRAATLELTAGDLNALIARQPQLAALRGRFFVEIVQGQLVADVSFPAPGSDPSQYFVDARATLDASYASGKFTFALRHAAPLRGEAKEGLLPSMLREPWFLQNYSEMINRDAEAFAHDQARNDPLIADVLAKVRTAVFEGDHLVLTSVARPEPAAVATPAIPE